MWKVTAQIDGVVQKFQTNRGFSGVAEARAWWEDLLRTSTPAARSIVVLDVVDDGRPVPDQMAMVNQVRSQASQTAQATQTAYARRR